MSLPVISTPTHFLTVPSTKKKVKFRPFLVKEEKIMLLIKESEDTGEIVHAMKEVIKACTFDKVDPDELAVFDIEYIFLQLRAKSIGENIELNMKCINPVPLPKADDHPAGVDNEMVPCGGIINFSINIDKIEVNTPKDHNKVVMVDKHIGITFKYPSMLTMVDVDTEKDELEIVVDLVENIFDKDNVYDAKDTKKEEIREFIENIPNKQFAAVREQFFESMPHISHTVKYKCPKCDFKGEHTFRGIVDFF